MVASDSLLTQTNGAAERCSRAAEILIELSVRNATSRAILSSIATECLNTRDILQRLGVFLTPGRQGDGIADYLDRDELRICFDALLQSINTTLVEVDVEVQRLRRYSAQGDSPVQVGLVPILQDFLYDARNSLRKNRSDLSIIMDCVKRYVWF